MTEEKSAPKHLIFKYNPDRISSDQRDPTEGLVSLDIDGKYYGGYEVRQLYEKGEIFKRNEWRLFRLGLGSVNEIKTNLGDYVKDNRVSVESTTSRDRSGDHPVVRLEYRLQQKGIFS